MSEELYKKYRPTKFSDVVGQEEAIKILQAKLKRGAVPQALLLTGPSGTGKTTIARILASKLKCNEHDLKEINASISRGIDTVREIQDIMQLAAMQSGGTRVFILDECHKLTSDAQTGLLKTLEDGAPNHCYFMLATTDHRKLLPTIRNRCTEIPVKPLIPEQLRQLIKHVAEQEKIKLTKNVVQRLVECAEGSARKVLVHLDTVRELEGEQEQLNSIYKDETNRQAIEIARLLTTKGTTWKEMSKLLREVEDDPETVRWLVLSYATTILLNSGNPKAYLVLTCFGNHFYESKKAGLVAACYEVLNDAR